jgi:alpha-galactosidase
MENFIKDIRRDLGVAKLPFVIANTGMGGHEIEAARPLKLMEDQLSMADPAKYPDFAGNVGAVDTRDFQRKREDSPSKQGYHWFRNWETYYLIGEGMGKKMIELLHHIES